MLVLTAGLWFTGCAKNARSTWTKIDLRNLGTEIDVPRSALKKFDAFVSAQHDNKIKLLPVRVQLTEVTEGVLGHHMFDIDLGMGGGAIDLADYLNLSHPGDFNLRFQLPISKLSKVHALFINHSRMQQISKESYGMACGEYLDISSFFKSTLTQQGLRLTTLHDLYATTVLGIFLIAEKTEQGWAVAAVEIRDSNQRGRECPEAHHSQETFN